MTAPTDLSDEGQLFLLCCYMATSALLEGDVDKARRYAHAAHLALADEVEVTKGLIRMQSTLNRRQIEQLEGIDPEPPRHGPRAA